MRLNRMTPNRVTPNKVTKTKPNAIITALSMLILVSLAPVASWAAQFRIATDNSEIHAMISISEVNRISLDGDRIKSVSKTPIGYDVISEPDTGDLYLVPSHGARHGDPVNMFITSERGYTYQLLLTPVDTPSEQVIIQGPRKRPLKARPVAPRRQALAALLRSMINGDVMDDYRRRAAHLSDIDHVASHLFDFQIREVWEGERFTGLSLMLGHDEPSVLHASNIGRNAAAVWVAETAGDERRAIIIVEAKDEGARNEGARNEGAINE